MVILPLVIVLAALMFAQNYEPLGTLHCDQGRHPVWIRVIAHLEGRSTERELEVWACLEDYQAMNEQ